MSTSGTRERTAGGRLTHVGDEVIPGVSPAVVVEGGRLAYLSGHVPLDAGGRLPEGFGAQIDQAFDNVADTLHRLGAGVGDLVRVTVFAVGLTPDLVPLVRGARDRFIGDAVPPSSALIGVDALFQPGVLVEIDAVVSLPPAERQGS
ncbi:RidA family protein [Nocardiopsis sp. LOL_012]|uniref:RidA family protein n=1 Tax=Nocardiopsis sp. LOL_012 TaxID=3345409 RepID=UPI003A8C2F04